FIPETPAGKRYADGSLQPELPEGAQQLAQFFFDPFGRGRGNNADATTGRTTSGQYVNLLQLRGNVLVTPERNTNSLIITTSPENEAAVRDLISELDVEVKQVLLEALVVEVTLDKQVKFGIDYLFENLKNKFEGVFPVLPPTGPLGGLGGDPLTSGLRGTIMRGDFRAIITAVGRDDRVRILSTPSIFTANNQEAEIDVTDRIPYLKGSTVGFGGQTTSNVDFEEVGLILNVTPRITADGMVRVDVYQEDSNLVEFRNVGTDAVAPLTTQRVTDTSVTLRDGDTLVLSGLQKTSRVNIRHKIPVLGDIPLLGNLFRSTNKRDTKTELIVFLTPRVVNNADEAKSISDKELSRVQKQAPEAKPRVPNADRM
ncbi:MAG: type II secretion system protein GspD, partial [Actinomycetota bacterium]